MTDKRTCKQRDDNKGAGSGQGQLRAMLARCSNVRCVMLEGRSSEVGTDHLCFYLLTSNFSHLTSPIALPVEPADEIAVPALRFVRLPA